jgi:hypothetical protein
MAVALVTTVRRTEARVAPLPDRPVSDSSSIGHCMLGETLRSTTWSGRGAKEAWWCTRTVALASANHGLTSWNRISAVRNNRGSAPANAAGAGRPQGGGTHTAMGGGGWQAAGERA